MKILSLSLFSEIWPHSYPEYLILKSLCDMHQFKIDYLGCESFFKSCAVHDSRQVSFSDKKIKKKICDLCIDTKNQYVHNSGMNHLLINDYLSKANLIEIKKIINEININNFMKLKVFNVEVSRFTLFNYFISQKKSNTKFNNEEFEKFKIRLEDSLKSLYAFNNIIKKNNYDYILAFSTEYSLNRVCVELAKQSGINILSIANGKHTVSKFKFIRIAEGYDQGLYYHANKKWSDFVKRSIVNENFDYVEEYINSFLGSKTFMNYSSKYTSKSIRKFFDIDKKYKKVVLVALSSQDERSGDFFSNVRQSDAKKCHSKFFNDDIEWCEWFLKKIDLFKDTYFVIRFHPRSFPSSRNSKKSDLINKINKIKSQKKDNLSFNFPDDTISIYDFLGEVNLLLHSSSSTSFEFGLFGIPSLTYDKNLFYFPDDISYSAKDLDDYLNKINFLLINDNYNNRKIIINAFKWLIIQLNYEFVDISDAYDPPTANSDKNLIYKYFLKIVNRIQKIIGINIIVRYLIKKNQKPKNLYMLKDIFEKNLKSNLDLTLTKSKGNANEYEDFKKCKTIMLNVLKRYPKLYQFYYDL
jgi:hypothetical protein